MSLSFPRNENAQIVQICQWNRLLDSLNKSTLDEGAAPLGDGEMTLLKDIESLEQEHDQYMREPKSGGQSD